jgi:hypothetical protein
MSMSIIQARLSENESAIVKEYARANNMSLSSLIRDSVFEKIENEIDLRTYEKAMSEFRKNPKTYSHEEVLKEFGLDS